MIVLGLTNDEKGSQLEDLTARLFKSIGYSDVNTNLVHAGASEVDVTGTYSTPIPGGRGPETGLIGECKAKRRRLDMDDWQKMLGKLWLARLKKHNTIAVLVSLNGFIGNVIAAHRDFDSELPEVIFLYDRGKVEGLAATRYGSATREAVEDGLRRFTPMKIVDLNLAYYGDEVFWLAEFTEGRFAMLDKAGNPMTKEEREPWNALVKVEIGSAEIIDLYAEHRALERQMITSRIHLAHLFESDGSCGIETLFINVEFSRAEQVGGLDILVNEGLVELSEDQATLSFVKSGNLPAAFHRTVSYFVLGKVPRSYFTRLFDSALYDRSIDECFAEYACKVQGNIPVPKERLPDLVFWLKLSPSAMLQSLVPDPLIVNHRLEESPEDPLIDEHDVIYLFEKMFALFRGDLLNPNLGRFHHNKGIFEVDTWTKLLIKAPGDVPYEVRSFRRDTSCDGIFGLLTSVRSTEELVGPEWEDEFFSSPEG